MVLKFSREILNNMNLGKVEIEKSFLVKTYDFLIVFWRYLLVCVQFNNLFTLKLKLQVWNILRLLVNCKLIVYEITYNNLICFESYSIFC